MRSRFSTGDYFSIFIWVFISIIWFITAILSIVTHDGLELIILRFFIVYLSLTILFHCWLNAKERLEKETYVTKLGHRIEILTIKLIEEDELVTELKEKLKKAVSKTKSRGRRTK